MEMPLLLLAVYKILPPRRCACTQSRHSIKALLFLLVHLLELSLTLLPIIMYQLLLLLTTVLPFMISLSSASSIPTKLSIRQGSSQVAVGTVINNCVVPGTIALTFDDGPWQYTHALLDTLAEHDAVATFFLNGINLGSISSFPDVLQRAVAEGHQLGSHTYVPPPSNIANILPRSF